MHRGREGLKNKTMYYVEKEINGILFFKNSPNGEWKEVSHKELLRRLRYAERILQSMFKTE